MPRARNIKPSLFKNEVLGQADPLLTLLFQGLWCLADCKGVLEDRPLRIKAEIFPYREISDLNIFLQELEIMGFIARYSHSGQALIQVLKFVEHQKPHPTEKSSGWPVFVDADEKPDLNVKKNGDILFKQPDLLNEERGILNDECGIKNDPVGSNGDDPPQKSDSKKELKDKIDVVFAYWQATLKKERHTLTDQRSKAIAARLKKYTVEQILRAIDGCACSPHHMGNNLTGTEYNDIELICRNDTKLEGFIEKAEKRVNGTGTKNNNAESGQGQYAGLSDEEVLRSIGANPAR